MNYYPKKNMAEVSKPDWMANFSIGMPAKVSSSITTCDMLCCHFLESASAVTLSTSDLKSSFLFQLRNVTMTLSRYHCPMKICVWGFEHGLQSATPLQLILTPTRLAHLMSVSHDLLLTSRSCMAVFSFHESSRPEMVSA